MGRDLFLEEFEQIALDTGRPITWTALLAGLSLGKGNHEDQLADSEALVAKGLKIAPQVTPRLLNFEYQWKEPFPFEAISLFKPVSAADFDSKCRIYKDPGRHPRLRTDLKAQGQTLQFRLRVRQ